MSVFSFMVAAGFEPTSRCVLLVRFLNREFHSKCLSGVKTSTASNCDCLWVCKYKVVDNEPSPSLLTVMARKLIV